MELCQMTRYLSHTLTRFLKDLFKRCYRPKVPSSLQVKEYQNQVNLTLLIGPGAQDFYLHLYADELEPCSTLVLGGLTLTDADRLLQQMPDLGSLLLVLPRILEEEIRAIVKLLRGWSGSLTQLIICARQSTLPYTPPYAAVSGQLLRLLAAINCLSQLEELRFHLEGYLLPADAKGCPLYRQSLYLPILEQLESFYFFSQDEASILTDSLARYLPSNNRLVQLNILNWIDEVTFQCLLEAGPWVAASLSTFITGWPLTTDQLERICGTFRGIQKLLIPTYSLPTAVHLLRSLKDLHTLILIFPTIQFEMNAIQRYLQQVGAKDEPLLDALRQVTRLEVNFSDVRSHQQVDALSLHRFFPKIKELFITSATKDCAICGHFGALQGREDRPEDEARAEACCQAMEVQMRGRFPFLQKVQATLD